MGACISWLAVPSDATNLTAYVGTGGAAGAPLRDFEFAHASTSTIDVSSRRGNSQEFDYITSTPLIRFSVLLQAHMALLTLRIWSYLSSLRYIVMTERLGDFDPNPAVTVFGMGLIALAVVLGAATLLVMQQNGVFSFVGAALSSIFCCCRCRGCQRGCNRRCSSCGDCILRWCCCQPTQRRQRRHDSDSETTSSEDEEDDDGMIENNPLRWRYRLTRTRCNVLVFGSLIDALPKPRTMEEQQHQLQMLRATDPWEREYPVDASGIPLEDERQLDAARLARKGGLPPDPHGPEPEEATIENRVFMVLVLAMWAPNALMCGVDWTFYSLDPTNPAYNGFFWLSFIAGFVTSLGPPWYYWQLFGVWWLEMRDRDLGFSPYSPRFDFADLRGDNGEHAATGVRSPQ